jgi:hypothetical protein
MASFGDILDNPESGWDRFDDTNSNIEYIGNWSHDPDSRDRYNIWNNHWATSSTPGDEIRFNFTGSGLILRAYQNTAQDRNIEVFIDGVSYGIKPLNTRLISCGVFFIVENLTNKEHTCKLIVKGTSNHYFDSIDLLSGEQLKPYNKNLYKYLLEDSGNIKTLDSGSLIDLNSITQDNFENNGISDLSNLRTIVSNNKLELNNNILDNGMKFNHNIDFSTLENINNIILS